MRFIDKDTTVQVQIARKRPLSREPVILADFHIIKTEFEEFLDHVIEECKKAYGRDELFPSIKKEET